MDMLHAHDYANMGIAQMNSKLKESKISDDRISRKIELVHTIL